MQRITLRALSYIPPPRFVIVIYTMMIQSLRFGKVISDHNHTGVWMTRNDDRIKLGLSSKHEAGKDRHNAQVFLLRRVKFEKTKGARRIIPYLML